MSTESPVPLVKVAILAVLVAAMADLVPAGQADDTIGFDNYYFEGVTTNWLWTVEGHPLLSDGSHNDVGQVSVLATCLDANPCRGEFTFVGGLGTANCRDTGSGISGTMDMYLANSFYCKKLTLQITGAGVCDVRITAIGLDWGVHTARGDGFATGVCEGG